MIYILCFLSSIFFARLASRSKNRGVVILYSALSILIPSLMGGLRYYTIGTDSKGYGLSLSLGALRHDSLIEYFQDPRINTEPGCKFLFYCGAKIFGSYTGAFLLFETLTMTFVYIGAWRHRKNIPLAMTMLVFYFLLYLRTYNEIRQCMAASIIFMGIYDLENSRYLKFSIYIAVAVLFHYSAVLAFVLLLGMHVLTTSRKYNNNASFRMMTILGVVIFLMIAVPVMRTVLSYIPFASKYEHYLSPQSLALGYNVIGKAYIILYSGEILMFGFYGKGAAKILNGAHGERNSSFYKFIAIFCAAYMIGVFFFDRILFYNDFANVLALAAFPRFVKDKHLSAFVLMIVTFTLLIFWYRMFIYLPIFRVWPYRSIF